MPAYPIPGENRALVSVLRQAASCAPGKTLGETRLHEFGGCRYLLRHESKPVEQLLLSFAATSGLPPGFEITVKAAYQDLAELTTCDPAYQVTLRVRHLCFPCPERPADRVQ